MMKSTSFLRELHRTYERIKGGYSGGTSLYKVDYYLVDNSGKVAGSNSRTETSENFKSKVRSYHEKFKRVGKRLMHEQSGKGVQSNENKYCV